MTRRRRAIDSRAIGGYAVPISGKNAVYNHWASFFRRKSFIYIFVVTWFTFVDRRRPYGNGWMVGTGKNVRTRACGKPYGYVCLPLIVYMEETDGRTEKKSRQKETGFRAASVSSAPDKLLNPLKILRKRRAWKRVALHKACRDNAVRHQWEVFIRR